MWFTALVNYQVVRASRDDALILAALRLQWERELGAPPRRGFVSEYADAWLAEYERLPAWWARHPDGSAAGYVSTRFDRKLPSLARPRTAVMHIAALFVRPSDRGRGVAEQLLRAALTWGDTHQVVRYTLNANPEARTLYQRIGFSTPDSRAMELRRND